MKASLWAIWNRVKDTSTFLMALFLEESLDKESNMVEGFTNG